MSRHFSIWRSGSLRSSMTWSFSEFLCFVTALFQRFLLMSTDFVKERQDSTTLGLVLPDSVQRNTETCCDETFMGFAVNVKLPIFSWPCCFVPREYLRSGFLIMSRVLLKFITAPGRLYYFPLHVLGRRRPRRLRKFRYTSHSQVGEYGILAPGVHIFHFCVVKYEDD